ncbi:unnamed protein product [Paramecium octaurelia]|uniref:Uncharacterized protein n=1 Tax=Paramecium octaurelia TaxID=43137 RepID=A0A8S1TS64_PAROT|nr:unnamed protein product [Paramecium octaurelia]
MLKVSVHGFSFPFINLTIIRNLIYKNIRVQLQCLHFNSYGITQMRTGFVKAHLLLQF